MENIFNQFEIFNINEFIDIEQQETKYNVILPPILKIFVQTFKIETFNSVGVYHINEEIGFGDFVNSISRNIEIYIEQGEHYQSKKMLPIAFSGIHSGGICVGLSGKDTDKIFIDNEMYPDRFEEVSENIFEFVRGLMIDL